MSRKALMVVGLLALAGCEQKPVDTPKHFAPPALWRIEVVEDSGGQAGVVMVCANPEVVSSFSRVEPNINGAPCQLYGQVAKDTADEHIKRCQVGDTRYGLYVTTTRQKVDDFTVRFALQPLQNAGGKVVQARRYQRIGPCPTGWKAGDQGPPGGAPTSNVLSGQGPG